MSAVLEYWWIGIPLKVWLIVWLRGKLAAVRAEEEPEADPLLDAFRRGRL